MLKKKWPSNTNFGFVGEGNTVEGLPLSLLLKAADSYCHFLSKLERENGEPRAKLPENV